MLGSWLAFVGFLFIAGRPIYGFFKESAQKKRGEILKTFSQYKKELEEQKKLLEKTKDNHRNIQAQVERIITLAQEEVAFLHQRRDQSIRAMEATYQNTLERELAAMERHWVETMKKELTDQVIEALSQETVLKEMENKGIGQTVRQERALMMDLVS